jgi:membrane protein required for colicin V production
MSTLDVVLLAIVAFCGVMGIYWGFIRQVLAIAGLLAGVALAGRYGSRVADWLSSYIASETIAQLLGFVLVLIAVSAAASLLATLIRRFVGLLFLGWLDHAIGGMLGLFQGALVCAVVLLVAAIMPSVTLTNVISSSRVAAGLVRLGAVLLLPFLPPTVRLAAEQVLGGL